MRPPTPAELAYWAREMAPYRRISRAVLGRHVAKRNVWAVAVGLDPKVRKRPRESTPMLSSGPRLPRE